MKQYKSDDTNDVSNQFYFQCTLYLGLQSATISMFSNQFYFQCTLYLGLQSATISMFYFKTCYVCCNNDEICVWNITYNRVVTYSACFVRFHSDTFGSTRLECQPNTQGELGRTAHSTVRALYGQDYTI